MTTPQSDPFGAPINAPKKSKTPAIIAGILVLALILAGGYWLFFLRDSDEATTPSVASDRPVSTAESESPAAEPASSTVEPEIVTETVTSTVVAEYTGSLKGKLRPAQPWFEPLPPLPEYPGSKFCSIHETSARYAGNENTDCQLAERIDTMLRSALRGGIFQEESGGRYKGDLEYLPEPDSQTTVAFECAGTLGERFVCESDSGYLVITEVAPRDRVVPFELLRP